MTTAVVAATLIPVAVVAMFKIAVVRAAPRSFIIVERSTVVVVSAVPVAAAVVVAAMFPAAIVADDDLTVAPITVMVIV